MNRICRAIIAGGRDFIPSQKHRDWLEEVITDMSIDIIISGGSSGADRFGEIVANDLGLPIETFNADWQRYGKAAGPMRNEEMACAANICILFPGGKGTADMKRRAIEHGLLLAEWRDKNA